MRWRGLRIWGCVRAVVGVLLMLGMCRNSLAAGWFDNPFRRVVEVIWDAEHGSSDTCYVEMLTGGHMKPDGADVRVSSEDGRQTAARVINIGPGDRASLIFSLVRGQKRYYVNFGNQTPAPNKPAFAEVKIESGLLLEMHEWTPGKITNGDEVEQAWTKAGPLIGRTMIDAPFYGLNPFGAARQTASKLVGSLFAPIEGSYAFAIFVEDRGVLEIDGKRVLYVTNGPADVSQQASVQLTRGRHDFTFYQLSTGGEGRFTVAWKRPDAKNFEPIPRGSFGIFARGIPGQLEEARKLATADFRMERQGECFFADGYSHRFRFAAYEPKIAAKASYAWDFGDGQTGAGDDVDHVYLTDGMYPVKLTLHVGATVSVQTTRLSVSRDWAHLDQPKEDRLTDQAGVVARYTLEAIPPEWLPRAVWLHQRASNIEAMVPEAKQLAALPHHPDANQAFAALSDASDMLLGIVRPSPPEPLRGQPAPPPPKRDVGRAISLWAAVPNGSDLQPRAAIRYAETLLWWAGDAKAAAAALAPFASTKDAPLQRLYADALLLNQKAEEAKKILEAQPPRGNATAHAARAGAMARTIEYYIESKDFEAGETNWDRWQEEYPLDVLDGYAIVLKERLMELKDATLGAANVAESFARAVPGSSYSPQLLFRASKLVEPTDSARAQSLIKLLKERYPEDPLSQ